MRKSSLTDMQQFAHALRCTPLSLGMCPKKCGIRFMARTKTREEPDTHAPKSTDNGAAIAIRRDRVVLGQLQGAASKCPPMLLWISTPQTTGRSSQPDAAPPSLFQLLDSLDCQLHPVKQQWRRTHHWQVLPRAVGRGSWQRH